MINDARITAEAAERARQLWLKIEAEFAWQIVQCREGMPAPVRLPGDPRPRDDETSTEFCDKG